jgi:hypothetical protein
LLPTRWGSGVESVSARPRRGEMCLDRVDHEYSDAFRFATVALAGEAPEAELQIGPLSSNKSDRMNAIHAIMTAAGNDGTEQQIQ